MLLNSQLNHTEIVNFLSVVTFWTSIIFITQSLFMYYQTATLCRVTKILSNKNSYNSFYFSGVAKNGDHENGNGKEHTNGDSENGHSKTEATTTEETMETSEEDKTESAPKRKADEIEPIPVSAEKIAKLKENEAEEKTETEATPAAEETA